jgi:hypothetical protein
MRRTPRHLLSLAAAASAAAGLTAFGCSLGLDPSLIGAEGGAGTDASGPQEGGPPGDGGDGQTTHPGDSSLASDAPLSVDAGACNTDSDCMAAAAAGGACVTSAKCDQTAHVCLLDVCGNSANCQVELCQSSSQTCTVPASYGFAPTSFSVTTGGVGGYGVQYAIAAAWPFVFVVTNNGLAAFNVADPIDPPLPVTVQNLPFFPDATITDGRRVYFITGTMGAGPTTFRQSIAWIDVPQNPLLTTLTASSALVSTQGNGIYNVFTDDSNGLFFLYETAALLYPTANAVPPFDDTTALTPYPNTGLPSGASVFATTGGRLLTYRYATDMSGPGYATPHFSFVNKPGTSMATTTTEQSFTAFGALDNQYGFSTGDDGSVVWETAVLDELDSGGNDGVATARLSWLIDSATAGNFDSTAYVDLVTYSPAAGGQVVGQPAWMDANTALGFAALSSTSTNTTLVQVVTKTPASIDPVRTTQLPAAPGAIGVATSNGFAYALLQNDPMNHSCTVQIIAPSCGGADQ